MTALSDFILLQTPGEGFFGWNYTDSVALNVISESEDMGANSLTPVCPVDNLPEKCKSLSADLPAFRVAADRLNKQNPGLDLNSTDVFQLMCMPRE
jgi:acid phosphatase